MKRLLVVLAMLAVTTACSSETNGVQRTKVRITDGSGKELVVDAEVADTPAERARGLMNREHLDEMQGMVFLWKEPERNVFWMKDTLIPLDMIFIREGKVVAISANARPMDESTVDPGVDSDVVLEVNGGWAQRHQVEVGDMVKVGF